MIDLHCRLFDARTAPDLGANDLEDRLAPWLEQLSGKGPSHVVAHANTPNERTLAARAVLPVVPSQEDFAYTLRLVSEVMASNGSTSMGSPGPADCLTVRNSTATMN